MAEGGEPQKQNLPSNGFDSALGVSMSSSDQRGEHDAELSLENDLELMSQGGHGSSSSSSSTSMRTSTPAAARPKPATRRRNQLSLSKAQSEQDSAQAAAATLSSRTPRVGRRLHSTYDSRLATYSVAGSRAQLLCRAGFYQTAEGVVRCWRCNACFPSDMPQLNGDLASIEIFHASLMPVCEYVIEQYGIDFVLQNNHKLEQTQRDILANQRSTQANRQGQATVEELVHYTLTQVCDHERRMSTLEGLHAGLQRQESETKAGVEEIEKSLSSLDLTVSSLSMKDARNQQTLSQHGEDIGDLQQKHDTLEEKVDENADVQKRQADESWREKKSNENKIEAIKKEQNNMKDNAKATRLVQNQIKKKVNEIETSENNIA